MKEWLILFLLVLYGHTCIGQFKYEKEERIQKEALPTAVGKLLPLLEIHSKRIRYYREFNGKRISYEVKFKKNNNFFSVEFNQDGVLEDIEVLISKASLPPAVLKTVKNHFQRVKFTQIQKQFVHPEGVNPVQTLHSVFKNQFSPTAYELEVTGKISKGYRKFELLIAPKGKLIKKSTILAKDYAHVVY